MKICPYCAEEIKAEAIKCKHCGSEMPEVQKKIVADQVKQDIVRQQVIAVMDANWAKNKLNISYVFIFVGLVADFVLFHIGKIPFNASWIPTFLFLGVIFMYCFWSLYWGVQIVYEPIKNWYSGLIIFESNIADLIFRQIVIALGMYLITIPLAGLVVGALGGGIVRTLKCVAIANNNIEPQTIVSSEPTKEKINPVGSEMGQGKGTMSSVSRIGWAILGGILLLIIICYFTIARN